MGLQICQNLGTASVNSKFTTVVLVKKGSSFLKLICRIIASMQKLLQNSTSKFHGTVTFEKCIKINDGENYNPDVIVTLDRGC